ncbi:transposase, partial [Methylobacterium sp. J-092]|uniref:transposase n=1 Tax=Methylobacterium sp. J-092 TaxID=2836667 RepID=UPI001FBBB13B
MARALLPDDLWDEIAPLLPPPRPRPKGGRRPIKNRAALTGMLLGRRAGWVGEVVAAGGGWGAGLSCCRRLRDWQAAGVWTRLHQVLLGRLYEAGHGDWSRASLDSASVPAKKGER